jgi:phosphoenolpyruvate-protein kinase (PTS system EI component)
VMELFAVDLDHLAGVVVEHGGHDSHAAILARSLGIPMVGQVTDFGSLLHSGRRLFVDGSDGTVGLDPPEDFALPVPSGAGQPGPAPVRPLAKGLPRVEVNLNLLYELGPALRQGAPGVGLFRSEFLFLARRTLPTEEEQVGIYRKLLQQLAGRPVTIRTFDLRPDKLASYSYLGSAEARPYDWRLVLSSPALQQLFRDQVRAVLRAAVLGPARILVPQVNHSELLDFVTATVSEACDKLRREGLECAEDVPLGVMIESAAAVPMVQDWAEHVAFFALGTNDLSATSLGIDRDDPVAVHQADPLHPGLLLLIDNVVGQAHEAGRPVSVCGEMGADPLGSLALAALHVDAVSVAVNEFAATRQALARLDPAGLGELRALLLRKRTASGVRELLQGWQGPGHTS